jgi:outer membrane protein
MKPRLNFLRWSFKLRRDLKRIGATILVLPSLCQAAMAQQFQPKAGDFVVRAGITALHFDSSASLALAGVQLSGAGVNTSNNFTGSLELDYYLVPNISMSLTLGIPPVTHVDGTGVLAPVGRLGDVRYGLGAFLIKYHYSEWGRFQPFAGAGLAYFKVFKASGVGISNLDVDDSVGPGFQVGFDYMVTQQIGLFASVSHAFLNTHGTGTFIGLPVTADVKLDPTVFQSGVTVRF